MNKLTLTRLEIRNFKGIPYFAMTLDGFKASVFGDNATGKTTLFDSVTWLLFDKDSQNKKDFSIKTLSDGKELHGLEHSVEATFDYNGKALELKKVYSEKWTKKRGSATQEFTGHTTDYYIDGVPSKKNEYQAKVDSIIKEDIFKLITSPSFFNEQVKWQDRRKTLLDICGDISTEEVISSNNELYRLNAILNGRSIEDHRKVIAARRTEINKELEKIPVRIDEIKRSLPQLDGIEKQVLETEISRLNTEIDEKMTLINNIRNGSAVSALQKQIQEIEIDLLKIKQAHQESSNEQVFSLKTRVQEENSNLFILNSKKDSVKQQKEKNALNIKNFSELTLQLRQEWHEVNSQQFTHELDCTCPTCGQSLPEEQVQSAKEKALAAFNLNKSTKLESITKKGKQAKEKADELQTLNNGLDKDIQKIDAQLQEKKELLEKLKGQLSTIENTIVDILDVPEYASKLTEKSNLNNQIREMREATDQSVQSIYGEVSELKGKRDQLQGELGKFALASQSQSRSEELQQQERILAAEFEKLEEELYLTEEFIRTKVNLLEKRINSKFKYARFKMFDQQINGGLSEVCETLFDGVPYSSGLNNAAKINVGLDIINTLSDHYGFSAPIFIDNAEAVTKLIDTKAQTISLIVSEQDKALRVEYIENKVEEAV
jgi:DNA repair exonuclease SbcCD ATPase subunit